MYDAHEGNNALFILLLKTTFVTTMHQIFKKTMTVVEAVWIFGSLRIDLNCTPLIDIFTSNCCLVDIDPRVFDNWDVYLLYGYPFMHIICPVGFIFQ